LDVQRAKKNVFSPFMGTSDGAYQSLKMSPLKKYSLRLPWEKNPKIAFNASPNSESKYFVIQSS